MAINIGKVKINPNIRTTIASPTFSPKVNVSITDIQSMNVESRQDGDTLIYNSTTGEYESGPIEVARIVLTAINGGQF